MSLTVTAPRALDGDGPRWATPSRPATLAWATAAAGLLVLGLAGAAQLLSLTDRAAGGPSAETRDWVLAVLCLPLGARIASHVPRNRCGWLVLAVGVLSALTIGASSLPGAAAAWVSGWLWWPGHGLLVLVVLLFPDGRPARPWSWVSRALVVATAVGTVALASVSARAPEALTGRSMVTAGPDTVALLVCVVTLVVAAACAVAGLVGRVRRCAAPQRPALRWTAVNAAVLLVALLLDAFGGVPLIWLLGAMAVPAAAVVGVVRFGLYDIDAVVHRSLAYGLVSAVLLTLYPVTVLAVGQLSPRPEVVAAAAVTLVALLPLREGAQRLVHRRLYGLSGRPYELLDTLGRRVGTAQLPEQVLAEAVCAVGEALRLPFVAARLDGRPDAEATFGRRRPWPVTSLDLTYRGQRIADLVVQQRSPDEPWTAAERRLLVGVAQQLGPCAASVRLTRELQAARERLVRAREEELRRLQRDLHDGVGAALTGSRMTASAVRARTGETDVSALLARLDDDLGDATVELRRILDGLRPPALDCGLVSALETAAGRHRRPGLEIDVRVDGDVSSVPAAVEVAAYRLVEEALANVAVHARARHASVRVRCDHRELLVRVLDDGTGPGPSRLGGLGVESMRERSEELGGTCAVTNAHPGTVVTARIPLS